MGAGGRVEENSDREWGENKEKKSLSMIIQFGFKKRAREGYIRG